MHTTKGLPKLETRLPLPKLLNSSTMSSFGLFRYGRQRKYISGGWIFPDGKPPDASRPPDGRTRGGESHPRPV
ncbi:MAG: hypothetical protein ACQESR_01200 [Planctomycetota bacterium]